MLNAIFLPVLYFLFPETADRLLEDLDIYYRGHPSLIVTKDPDAISRKRPAKYDEMRTEVIRDVAAVDEEEAVLTKDEPMVENGMV